MKLSGFLPMLFIAAAVSLSSCQDEVSNMGSIERLKDTIAKSYPNKIAGLSVEVNDYHVLNVVVRSSRIYNTDGENKQKVAAEIGNMALSAFGTNNELDKGQVIFTKDERSTDMNPPDGDKYPISFPEKQ